MNDKLKTRLMTWLNTKKRLFEAQAEYIEEGSQNNLDDLKQARGEYEFAAINLERVGIDYFHQKGQ